MRAVFIAHSGVLVETEQAALLFDWWKGDLPAIRPEVPLLVFASHRHEDHFNPAIFSLDSGSRDVHFILGHDIKPTPRNLDRWNIPPQTAEKIHVLKGGQTCILPCAEAEALPSTDEGAAFLVTLGGKTIFHAGDLNWWHWEGEDKAWNHNMAANFKKYTEPLRGRNIDLAMLPLDPRLGKAGFWGPKYFLELAGIRCFLPIHQWNDFGFTDQFLAAYPAFSRQTLRVLRDGQAFRL